MYGPHAAHETDTDEGRMDGKTDRAANWRLVDVLQLLPRRFQFQFQLKFQVQLIYQIN